ncbi:MAG: glycogen/starch synthase [Bacteroidales bacterium]|nr:glycogen/starch synthase [Bacteroidales bacterium]
MSKGNILFVMQEIMPYLPESKLSTVGRYLPQAVQDKGYEIRTFMPRYGVINERRFQLHEVIRLSGVNMVINNNDHPLIIKVASIQSARMQVYFIDNEEFFKRKFTVLDDNGCLFPDSDERLIFYARGVLETVKKLRWAPDIVHCHGWFSALLPLYLHKGYEEDPIFDKAKVIFTIYDDNIKGEFNKDFYKKIPQDKISLDDVKIIEKPTYENLMKLAIMFSDEIVFASEKPISSLIEFAQKLNKTIYYLEDKNDYISYYLNIYDTICKKNFIEEF